MTAAVAGVTLHEHVVLHKFEGNDQARPPFASIVIDDGTITSRCDDHDWRRPTGDAPLACGHCGEVWPNGTD